MPAPGRKALRRMAVAVLAPLTGLGVLALAAPTVWTHAASAGRITSVADADPAPVAIVLGAEVHPDGSPSEFLRGRLQTALDLYRGGKVKVILVTGDNGTVAYNETDAMIRWLVAQGVPAGRVVGDYAGFDTYDSAVRAARIFGVTRAIVVTQTYHLYRAVATFRAVGVDATGVGDDSVHAANKATWLTGAGREVLAGVKMVIDLGTHRVPTMGARETAVDEALARP